MCNPFDEFSALEREGWQRVAGKYEEARSGKTRLFIAHLLQATGVSAGARLLDVACGPGYVAEAAFHLGAEPIGVDFSAEMIRLARKRNPKIDFREGDAQALDFRDGQFDIVVMSFGVPHLPNPEAAFAEARRVLRPGGRYGFTLWAAPELSPADRILEDALTTHVDPGVKLPRMPDRFAYGNRDRCSQALARAGFDSATLDFRTVMARWRVPTAAFIFESERDAGVRAAAVLARQSPEVLKRIQNQIENAVRGYESDGAFAVPCAAHVIAVKAG
jgi:ubiquinone/menaquinone biosynthesis C-methylase UbiE